MQVIATAGHVDHGKSALLRALTGMEPDRWEEERRRGLTIDLGFVWTRIAGTEVAFVDVPGHERFVGNMLAGVGPVPAVLFVVAADEGWMPQSAEHLLALHALGVRHGLLAVTKTDIMEPELAAQEALDEIRRTSLGEGDLRWIGVSARTGDGLDRLRQALDELVARLPGSDPSEPVRLWIDRRFTIRGAGLVVTGTLTAGTVRIGDTLELAGTGARFVVRELQSLNQHVREATGVARVALNLRGRGEMGRGDALMTPGSYRCTAVADVRTRLCDPADLPRELLVHVGTATVECRVRPIGADTVRLTMASALPLRLGDRLVLRHDRGVAGGAAVLDVDPSALNRRGAGRRRADELASFPDAPDGESELRRRGIVREGTLRAAGVRPPVAALVADWLVAPALASSLRERLTTLVAGRAGDQSAPPLGVEEARKALALPDARLVPALLSPPWTVRSGVIVRDDSPDTLAPAVRNALRTLEQRLAADFVVPGDDELAGLGLRAPEVAAAVRAGRLVRLAPDVVLLPATMDRAVGVLAGLPQPFTAGQAREALGTTRKVVVPLLEHLAQRGRTRRHDDGRHAVTGR